LRDWVKQRFRGKAGVLTGVVAIVFCFVILYGTAIIVPKENKIANHYKSGSLNYYIVSREENTFVLSYGSYKRLRNRTVLQDPLYIGPDPVFDKCLYFGSPYYAHPSYNALLERHGVTNLYTALIDSEEFLFVDRKKKEIDMLLAYLTEQYGNGKTYTCERVAVRDKHYIYRIRTAETIPYTNET
jgi:hypothetical protein